MSSGYRRIIDQRFRNDLQFIKDNKLVDPSDLGLFQARLNEEFDELDANWKVVGKPAEYPPLSTDGWWKKYMHSISHRDKQRREWADQRADFRIVFRVDEVKKEIYYLSIGKRIKGLPKNPMDVWARLKDVKLPKAK